MNKLTKEQALTNLLNGADRGTYKLEEATIISLSVEKIQEAFKELDSLKNSLENKDEFKG